MKKVFYVSIVYFLTTPFFVGAQVTAPLNPPPGTQVPLNPPLDPNAILQNPLSANSIPEVLDRIINFLLVVAAPLAVIMTIWSAYLFVTAGDNEEKVKQARQTLMWVVIGVAVLILSKGIVSLAKSFIVF